MTSQKPEKEKPGLRLLAVAAKNQDKVLANFMAAYPELSKVEAEAMLKGQGY